MFVLLQLWRRLHMSECLTVALEVSLALKIGLSVDEPRIGSFWIDGSRTGSSVRAVGHGPAPGCLPGALDGNLSSPIGGVSEASRTLRSLEIHGDCS